MFAKLVLVLLSVSIIQANILANKGIVPVSDCGEY